MQIFKTCKKIAAFSFLALIFILFTSFIFNRSSFNTNKSYGSYIPGSDELINCQNTEIFPANENKFFILVEMNNQTYFYTFDSSTDTCKLQTVLNFKYTCAKSSDGKLFIGESNESGSEGKYSTLIYMYSLQQDDTITTREISLPLGVKITNKTSFDVCKDNLVFINEDDNSKIIKYNYQNDDIKIFSFEGSNFQSIALNISKSKMYALTNNLKYVVFDLNEDTGTGIEIFVCPDTFCKFLKDNLLVSDSNTIYTEKDNTITKNFKIESFASESMSTLFYFKDLNEEYILSVFDDSTIHCFNTSLYQKSSTPQKKVSLKNHKILALSASTKKVIAVLKDSVGINIKIISKDDLEDYDSKEDEDDSKKEVENDLYIINFETRRIIIKKDIKTVNEFRDNFEFGGYTISSFKNYLGKDISGSEKIGTGSTVVFTKGDSSLEFKIIVLSDITGEGNLNSKDLTALYNYLLGKTPLTDEVLQAADINRDKEVDTLDLLTLEKMLNGSLENVKTSSTSLKLNDNEEIFGVEEQFFDSKNTNSDTIFKCSNFSVNNLTGLNVNFEDKLKESLNFNIQKDDSPKVLVIHTHTSESYLEKEQNFYYKGFDFHSKDNSRNVIRVGKAVCDSLKKNKVRTIHSLTYHDTPQFHGCYDRAEETIKKILVNNPSIKVILDIHRDSIETKNKIKIKPTVNINGKKAAQIMLFTSCDTKGDLNHPNWEKNLLFSLKFQKEIENTYPGLARPLCFTHGRFNQHLCPGAVLIEVGSEVNSLDEAVYSGTLIGEVLANFLNKI